MHATQAARTIRRRSVFIDAIFERPSRALLACVTRAEDEKPLWPRTNANCDHYRAYTLYGCG